MNSESRRRQIYSLPRRSSTGDVRVACETQECRSALAVCHYRFAKSRRTPGPRVPGAERILIMRLLASRGSREGKQTELATFRQGQEDRQFESTPLQRAVTANLPAAIRKPAIGSALQLDGSHQISTALRYPCSATLGFPPSTRRRSGSPATRSSASHQVFEIWGFISLCTWPGASRCTRGCPL